jgi:hypothetical protein
MRVSEKPTGILIMVNKGFYPEKKRDVFQVYHLEQMIKIPSDQFVNA